MKEDDQELGNDILVKTEGETVTYRSLDTVMEDMEMGSRRRTREKSGSRYDVGYQSLQQEAEEANENVVVATILTGPFQRQRCSL